MSAALCPEPDEPSGSGLPGDAGGGVPQGLYVTLPAEELSLDGFAEDGRADAMAPGPLLAMVLGAVAGEHGEGLAGLSDDSWSGSCLGRGGWSPGWPGRGWRRWASSRPARGGRISPPMRSPPRSI